MSHLKCGIDLLWHLKTPPVSEMRTDIWNIMHDKTFDPALLLYLNITSGFRFASKGLTKSLQAECTTTIRLFWNEEKTFKTGMTLGFKKLWLTVVFNKNHSNHFKEFKMCVPNMTECWTNLLDLFHISLWEGAIGKGDWMKLYQLH